jgi:hypothetical protein
MVRFVPIIALAAALHSGVHMSAQDADLTDILTGLAARTQQYYDRFISIICTETVRQQELRYNLSPLGKPRVTVYELSVSRDPSAEGEAEFRVGRTLQSVNGRQARKNQEPGCTDPKTGSPEPLAFLLAGNQRRYKFTDSSGSRDYHLEGELLQRRRRRAGGARVVRSRQLRRSAGGAQVVEAVSGAFAAWVSRSSTGREGRTIGIGPPLFAGSISGSK